MNIKDLAPGSYTVVQPNNPVQPKMNIRDLAPGSYQVVKQTPPVAPVIQTTLPARIGASIAGGFEKAKQDFTQERINKTPFAGVQALGDIAGGVIGGAGEVVKSAWGALPESAGKIGIEKLSALAGQGIAKTGLPEQLSAIGQMYPETTKTLKAVANIASVLPVGIGGKVFATGAVEAGTKGITVAKTVKEALQEKARTKIVSGVQKDVQDFIVSKKSIENTVKKLESQKVPVREMLADEPIFRGLKVEKGTINPDEAIGVVRNRIDESLNITQDFLPEVDKYAPKISRETYRARAHASVNERGLLPADAKDITKAIDNQIDALPDEFLPSQLDKVRAQARVSARDAKGQLKRDSEYAAMETAARDLVFESVDNLPSIAGGEFAKLRTYIKHNIDLEKFLDTTMRGQKVKGGRLGTYGGRIVGAVAGSQGGIFGAIVGGEVGAKIASILTNSSLGSSAKLRLIGNATDNPIALQKAREMLAKQMQYEAPRLPAPEKGAFRSVQTGGAPIVPPVTSYELPAQKIMTEPIKQPAEKLRLNAPGQNPIQLRSPQSQSPITTPAITVSKKTISKTLPQTLPKSKVLPKAQTLETVKSKAFPTSHPLTTDPTNYKTAEEYVGALKEQYITKLKEVSPSQPESWYKYQADNLKQFTTRKNELTDIWNKAQKK